jgi:hypothetical protein
MEGRLLSMILVPNREVIEQMARQEKAAAKAAAKLAEAEAKSAEPTEVAQAGAAGGE